MPERRGFTQNLCIVLALAGLTLLLYWPARGFDFTNYDDLAYVTANPVVQNGLKWRGIRWAFETNWSSNWHPLTWMSHMLDCSLYGLNPGGHHFTSVLFHTANSVVLFLVLWRLTASRWRSALVAALFAWHPLHVESVAWIAERKDPLSACFWFLAMWAYAAYAKPSPAARPKPLYRNGAYLLTFLLLACGLLAKPMVVTLPFVFMLMDVWPLDRVAFRRHENNSQGPNAVRKIHAAAWIGEKIPFFALSALDCLATFWAQKDANAVISAASLPIGLRFSNALAGYVTYLGKIFWPSGLTVHYPFSEDWNPLKLLGALALLTGITLIALGQRRERGFLLTGWLWFLGTLVPVIGLVQVGTQGLADRYTYIPAIGIFIMLAWSLPEKWFQWPRPGLVAACLTGGILIGTMTLAEMQLQYWRNSITLFTHATQVSPDDLLSEYNLGEALTHANFLDAAIPHFRRVLGLKLNRAEMNYDAKGHAHYNLGLIFRAQRHWPEAEEQFRAYLRSEPQAAAGHLNLGVTLVAQDRPQEGLAEFRMTAARNGRNPVEAEVIALADVDAAYAEAGKLDQALAAIRQTLERAQASGNQTLIETTGQRLKFYREEMAKKK